jgi:manganese/zinc/iron transport system permease protein
MAALLITPAAAARAWSNRLSAMIGIAAATAALSAVVGSWVSYSTPNMPTGPWVVMSLSFLALGSLVVAPQRGLLARLYRQKANRQKILRENLLKTFYKLGESAGSFQGAFSLNDLKQIRDFTDLDFKNGLRLLLGQHYLLAYNQGYKLTRKGLDEARRVVRLHRLWEMYLTQRMRLKSDHIHPNAETIEHIITPEIEEQLLRELNYPAEDPHSSPIPYQP